MDYYHSRQRGGIRLNPKALDLKLGTIVRILQGDHQIVECNTPPCVLRSHCGLKGILDQALESFYQSLDQYTLGEVLQQPKSASDHSPIAFYNSRTRNSIYLLSKLTEN